MRCTFAVFLVLIASSTSVSADEPKKLEAKEGWPLRPPLADAAPVVTKIRLPAHYPAGSRIEDEGALGGFGPCDNWPFALGQNDWGTKGKVALVAFPEEKVAYFKHQGIALRVINRSDKVVAFAAFNSMMFIIREAQDETGLWREIESSPDLNAFCGNSFHRVLLGPGQAIPCSRLPGGVQDENAIPP
jgi:hypothetical protein